MAIIYTICIFHFQLDKPGTPSGKPRSSTPNNGMPAQGAPAKALPNPAGYQNVSYQRPQDPYQRPPPQDAGYGRPPPMAFDPHGHARTNGLPLPGSVAGGKP